MFVTSTIARLINVANIAHRGCDTGLILASGKIFSSLQFLNFQGLKYPNNGWHHCRQTAGADKKTGNRSHLANKESTVHPVAIITDCQRHGQVSSIRMLARFGIICFACVIREDEDNHAVTGLRDWRSLPLQHDRDTEQESYWPGYNWWCGSS